MTSKESEEKTQEAENEPKNENNEYEILPDDYPKYDLSFKIIVIGNSGKAYLY